MCGDVVCVCVCVCTQGEDSRRGHMIINTCAHLYSMVICMWSAGGLIRQAMQNCIAHLFFSVNHYNDTAAATTNNNNNSKQPQRCHHQ